MTHQCPMCPEFSAPTLKLLLGHICRVHSHSPQFSFTCGLQGCLTTFRSYVSLKKHINRKHKRCPLVQDASERVWQEDDQVDTQTEDNSPVEAEKENTARYFAKHLGVCCHCGN